MPRLDRSTGAAAQNRAHVSGSAAGRQYPGTDLPGRRVPNVLRMPTLELGHPVLLLVLMKTNDASLGYHPG